MNGPATPVPDGPLVDIADLHFSYGTRPILSGVTMRFGRGQVIAVMDDLAAVVELLVPELQRRGRFRREYRGRTLRENLADG